VRHIAGAADAPSLGDPVARQRGFAPEVAIAAYIFCKVHATLAVALKLASETETSENLVEEATLCV
jgi:hypothetical protein